MNQELAENTDPMETIWRRITLASVLQWESLTDEAIKTLEKAIPIAAENAPQLESELRLIAGGSVASR